MDCSGSSQAAHPRAIRRTRPSLRDATPRPAGSLQSIWEGSGNVAALDALRATRQPESAEAFFAELDQAAGADRRLDQGAGLLHKELSDPSEARARHLAEAMALTLQGLLVRTRDPAVADAFVASRLAGDWGLRLRHAPSGTGTAAIIERATPVILPDCDTPLSPKRRGIGPERLEWRPDSTAQHQAAEEEAQVAAASKTFAARALEAWIRDC